MIGRVVTQAFVFLPRLFCELQTCTWFAMSLATEAFLFAEQAAASDTLGNAENAMDMHTQGVALRWSLRRVVVGA